MSKLAEDFYAPFSLALAPLPPLYQVAPKSFRSSSWAGKRKRTSPNFIDVSVIFTPLDVRWRYLSRPMIFLLHREKRSTVLVILFSHLSKEILTKKLLEMLKWIENWDFYASKQLSHDNSTHIFVELCPSLFNFPRPRHFWFLVVRALLFLLLLALWRLICRRSRVATCVCWRRCWQSKEFGPTQPRLPSHGRNVTPSHAHTTASVQHGCQIDLKMTNLDMSRFRKDHIEPNYFRVHLKSIQHFSYLCFSLSLKTQFLNPLFEFFLIF